MELSMSQHKQHEFCRQGFYEKHSDLVEWFVLGLGSPS